jgi:uncharacterized repeat protein (TIGR04076 family)
VYELKVTVTKVMGVCTADPPMKPGDHFFVRDGNIRIPDGGYICLWALQNLLPVLTPKEREIAEERDEDWMWRVHHVQCPDPDGRVIFKIERTGKIRSAAAGQRAGAIAAPVALQCTTESSSQGVGHGLHDLRVVVEEVRGKCTSGMRPGDYFALRSGRLYIPARHHFCLYALHAALPMLPAKQRPLRDDDWLKAAHRLICPDPAGNVIMRVEKCLPEDRDLGEFPDVL